MAELTPERAREALRTVLFPNFRRDLVTLGMVGEEIAIDGDTVRLHVRPGTDKPEVLQQLARAIDAALRRLPGVAHVDVHFARAEEGRGRDPFAQRAALPGVAHIIAVASTKGGVGKSTVAVNLALALAGEGRRRVGLVDADVYGPSLPIMFGTDARPRAGAVVVTTPQDVALLDVGRGMAMFAQVSTPVLGVVENMSGYLCPRCGTEDPIFGRGGADALAARFGVPVLARIPLVPALREGGDAGRPLVAAQPEHPASRVFAALAARVAEALAAPA